MNRIVVAIIAIFVCVTALTIRAPLITAGAPYLYQEDDAHHYNRTVEMYQRGDLNPHYFNKPSLHFYLRLPIVAASVMWAKRHGELLSSREIRTRDPYGLAGYSFTTSHPTILIWNRAFSVAMSVAIILLTFILARQTGCGPGYATFAALIPSFSLEMVRNSHIIGVDILMALMCVACSVSAVWATRQFSALRIVVSGVFAGLAASSKYNAGPIALVPLAACYFAKRLTVKWVAILAVVTLSAFLAASPYIVISFAEFKTGLSYEIWHYGVAGHGEHTANRGLDQAVFYGRWLLSDGTGFVAALLAMVGIVRCLVQSDSARKVMLVLPLSYALLMILQRANFTRNMVVIVPYVGVCAAIGLHYLLLRISSPKIRITVGTLTAALALAPPLLQSLDFVVSSTQHQESREILRSWLTGVRSQSADVAVSGNLQIPFALYKLPGVDAFDLQKRSLPELAQEGFDFIVVPRSTTGLEDMKPLFTEVLSIPGVSEPQRLPDNPEIVVLSSTAAEMRELAKRAPASMALPANATGAKLGCEQGGETYCWIPKKVTTVTVAPLTNSEVEKAVPRVLTLEIMSPWANQKVEVRSAVGEVIQIIDLPKAGAWVPLVLEVDKTERVYTITTSILRSPKSHGISKDSRRLGVALRARNNSSEVDTK